MSDTPEQSADSIFSLFTTAKMNQDSELKKTQLQMIKNAFLIMKEQWFTDWKKAGKTYEELENIWVLAAGRALHITIYNPPRRVYDLLGI